jgi:tetratricopeptide (TPR) repeat protein
MAPLHSILTPAIKVAAAGLGSVVAGPLGGALGGLLGDALGGESSRLIREYAAKFGDKAAEKLLDEGQDALLERLKDEAPRLEAAYRVALAASLKKLRQQSAEDHSDWFDHWERCLSSEDTLALAGMEEIRLTPAAADHLLNRVLIRIDAQGLAMMKGSTAISLTERAMPTELAAALHERLPEVFRESFQTVIVTESYESAWRELNLACQQRMEELLLTLNRKVDKVDAGVGKVDAKLDRMMDAIRQLQADKAVTENRISPELAQLQDAEKERDEWKSKYLKLLNESPSLKDLLQNGDLEAVVAAKQQEIERKNKDQAKNYFELGSVHELRFDFSAAVEAYGHAWGLEKNPLYGFRWASAMAKQNRHDEAIALYLQLIKSVQPQEDIAATLNNLGVSLRAIQMFGESENAYRMAAAIYRCLSESDKADYHPKLADTLNNLGVVLEKAKKPEEAGACFDEAFTIYLELMKTDLKGSLPGAAATAINLGVLLQGIGNGPDALNALNQAIGWYAYLAIDEKARYLPSMANALLNRGVIYRGLKKPVEAEWDMTASVDGFRWLVERQRAIHLPGLAKALTNLGTLYHQSNAAKGKELHTEAAGYFVELNAKSSQAFVPELANTLNNLAACCYTLDEYDEAERNCLAAEKLLESYWKQDPVVHGDQFGRILGLCATIWKMQGKPLSKICQKAHAGLAAARTDKVKTFLKSIADSLCPQG